MLFTKKAQDLKPGMAVGVTSDQLFKVTGVTPVPGTHDVVVSCSDGNRYQLPRDAKITVTD